MKASKKKILLIDPSEPNGSEFRAVLCGLDFQIIDLQNTIIATQKVIEELPHIVCCNHKLPEFSGFQMYNILEDTLQKKQIPFLLILPCMDKISLLMGEELGIDGYIFPPFEPEEVNNILYTQLQKKIKEIYPGGEKIQNIVQDCALFDICYRKR
jgi:response regulator RpfG family c-di-GMP phosphodiesterase